MVIVIIEGHRLSILLLVLFTEGELSTGNYIKPKRGDTHGREGLATLAQFSCAFGMQLKQCFI